MGRSQRTIRSRGIVGVVPQRASQDARRAEGIVPDAMRIGLGVANDDVVEKFDVDGLGSLAQLRGFMRSAELWEVADAPMAGLDWAGSKHRGLCFP